MLVRATALTAPGGAGLLPFLLLGFLLAAALSYGLSVGVLRLCLRFNLLDKPGPRRVHTRPTPRLGGIAIFLAFLTVSLLFFRPTNANEARIYAGLLVAALLVVIVMAYDDVRGLPPLPRLAVQTLAALIVMFPGGHGVLIEVIHNPLVAASHEQTALALWLAVPFTWFWIVGMMNTINWVDGLDELAAGVVTITAGAMTAISWELGQYTTAILCAILAGATLGFLPLNWRPARIFMGDSGAMFLGLALAVLSNVGGAKLATMLLLLGLPILDTAWVIVRRLHAGHSPLRADRAHLHHRLLASGLSQRQIALIFYAITATFGVVTILAAYLQAHASDWTQQLRLIPWLPVLSVAATEAPTLLGLALVVLVSVLAWRWAAWRRKRTGLPPGASSAEWMTPAHSTPKSPSPPPSPRADPRTNPAVTPGRSPGGSLSHPAGRRDYLR
ncbi:MAG: MraY family glycosyltransferase [Ktedonobacterales bacterium]